MRRDLGAVDRWIRLGLASLQDLENEGTIVVFTQEQGPLGPPGMVLGDMGSSAGGLAR